MLLIIRPYCARFLGRRELLGRWNRWRYEQFNQVHVTVESVKIDRPESQLISRSGSAFFIRKNLGLAVR